MLWVRVPPGIKCEVVQCFKNKDWNMKIVNKIAKLKKVRAYYIRCFDATHLYSSYFLLGFRKNYAIVRLSSMADTLSRLFVLFNHTFSLKTDIWVCCFDSTLSRLARWVAASNGCTLMFKDKNDGEIIFCWKGRYFSILDVFFDKILHRYLACSILILIGHDDLYLVPYMSAKGALVVSIGSPDITPKYSSYKLYASADLPTLFVFYSRILSYFIKQTIRK